MAPPTGPLSGTCQVPGDDTLYGLYGLYGALPYQSDSDKTFPGKCFSWVRADASGAELRMPNYESNSRALNDGNLLCAYTFRSSWNPAMDQTKTRKNWIFGRPGSGRASPQGGTLFGTQFGPSPPPPHCFRKVRTPPGVLPRGRKTPTGQEKRLDLYRLGSRLWSPEPPRT